MLKTIISILFFIFLFFTRIINPLQGQNIDSITIRKNLETFKKVSYPETGQALDNIKVLLQLPALKQNPYLHSETLTLYSDLLTRHAKYDESIDSLKSALIVCKKASKVDSFYLTKILSNLGTVAGYSGKGTMEKKWLTEAIELRTLLVGAEDVQMASLYLNYGAALLRANQPLFSISYFQKVIRIREKHYGLESKKLQNPYNNIAIAYTELSNLEQAEKFSLKATALAKKNLLPNDPKLAYNYNTLANIYDLKGDYAQAISLHQKALALRLKILGIEHLETADSYYNLAILYKKTGDYETSLELILPAIDIYGEVLGKNHLYTLECLLVQANCLSRLDQANNAEVLFNFVIEQLEKITDGTADQSIGSAYGALGEFYLKNNLLNQAAEAFEKKLSVFLDLYGEQHAWTAEAYYQQGMLAVKKGLLPKAKILFINSLNSLRFNLNQKEFNKCINLELVQEPLIFLADLYAKEGNKEEAFRLFGLYQDLNDWLRQSYSESLSKRFLVEQELLVAEKIFDAAFDGNSFVSKNKSSFLFQSIERTKAALLLEALRQNTVLTSIIPDNLREKENSLRSLTNFYREKAIQLELSGISPIDTTILSINEDYLQAKENYEKWSRSLEKAYPVYGTFKNNINTLSLEMVQNDILTSNQGILEYFVTEQYIYASLVLKDTIIFTKTHLDRSLDFYVNEFLQGISSYYTAKEQNDHLQEQSILQYVDNAIFLYEKLIAPLKAYLPQQITLIPDGSLNLIPFEAILYQKPQDINAYNNYPYLMKRYQFNYAFSVASLELVQHKKHLKKTLHEVLSFAPFSMNSKTEHTSSILGQNLSSLKYSAFELEQIATIYPSRQLLAKLATKIAFLELAPQYQIIHLATHAKQDISNNALSFLSFSSTSEQPTNNLLFLKDIYALQLNSDLVVLSACETNNGSQQRGEGVISLARAFTFAGAKSIVSSLWNANDQSTSMVMKYFYEELAKGSDKAAAMQKAKIKFLKQAPSAEACYPYFWAAFIPIGDTGKLE